MIQSLILSVITMMSASNYQADNLGLNWKVGEKADYSLEVGSFIKGSMKMSVRELNDKGFWVNQDADLGFAGKQKVEILYDKYNGAVLEMIVNGEKQTPPDPAEQEIVETKNEQVTVPAGTFASLFVKLKNTKDNKITDAWINPEKIPISGLLKTNSDSQMGKVKIALTSFQKL